MFSTIAAWFSRTVMFGTVMMYGCVGETITERSGNLNLGIPGIMCIGGFAGFAGGYFYERAAGDSYNGLICVLLAVVSSFIATMLVGLIYCFFTITLRANQNVTGLTITIFGVGLSKFLGTLVMGEQTTIVASRAHDTFSTRIPWLYENVPYLGDLIFSYGFLVYLAIFVCVGASLFLFRTKTGLNLRAIGENPATADAAGINITRYKYLSICIGTGISGLGGLYYVLDYNRGMWVTENGIEALGWLAVALVIFTTWRPMNAIWGAILFGFLSWAYQFLPNLGVTIPNYAINLVQALPYVVTIFVLVIVSLRKKRENQAPQSLGLPYFREER